MVTFVVLNYYFFSSNLYFMRIKICCVQKYSGSHITIEYKTNNNADHFISALSILILAVNLEKFV